MDNIIKIRIGNDIPLIWKMYTQGESGRVPYNLEGRDIKIEMTNCNGGRIAVTPEINGNAASWTFRGKEQKNLGEYILTFYENFGQDGMKALDKLKPFALVPWQEVIQSGVVQGATSTLEVSPIVIESNLGDTVSYLDLTDKPKINHIVLIGDKTLAELGIASAEGLAQENARAQSAEQALASTIGAESQRARETEQSLQNALNAEIQRSTEKDTQLTQGLQTETQRAQQAEGELSQDLAEEVERATAKEAELEAAIAQAGKVDDVEVDDISVVTNKVAKIYTRIKGFAIGGKLHLELSHNLNLNNGKINVTNPYAHIDGTTHKIYI